MGPSDAASVGVAEVCVGMDDPCKDGTAEGAAVGMGDGIAVGRGLGIMVGEQAAGLPSGPSLNIG